MRDQSVTVSVDNLLAGAALVPPDRRTAFLATLLVGSTALETLNRGVSSAAISANQSIKQPWSYALNEQQARKLKEKIDPLSWNVLRAAVGNVKNDVATVDWSDVKKITGVASWTVFAKGRLGGLNRALHHIPGVPNDAVLLWEGDDNWVPHKNDYSSGDLCIDGPAVHALRSVMGL